MTHTTPLGTTTLCWLALACMPIMMVAQPRAATLTAKEIVQRADERLRGAHSIGEVKMTIVRPKWTREMTMKSWSRGRDYSLIVVTAPARDKGTAFLKRQKEIWNWQPTIERAVKLPPSMMMQSWMGSDFTNDDFVRESSILHDYTHALAGTETVGGLPCYKVVLTPVEGAPVVWGKVVGWIDQKDFMQMKTAFYDEDGELVSTMTASQVRDFGTRRLPARLEVVPADQPGHKTVVEHLSLDFDTPVPESFFSTQNMRRAR